MTSRLERMIARLITQRACIGAAARRVEHLEGPVLEIGLGKGRTYTHLRQVFAGREIIAFDADLHAPPGAAPPQDCLLLGDFRETLPAMARRRPGQAVLVHADFGSEDCDADKALAQEIAAPITELVAPQGIVVSDRPLSHPALGQIALPAIELPEGIAPWRYFMYETAQS
ncbi:class I SAM-dependent methyltransferase [Pelagibius marinus]|uniref:class I SAM-dependent methyltransferase n=1 Tax=Pelagibius marinus TaxID=2762760 RepID=UPI001872DD55|nr:class I SAM-dependent methyltransferase [Pelagibius marinus]